MRSRIRFAPAIAFTAWLLAAAHFGTGTAAANSVSGWVYNNSVWTDQLSSPGDGDGLGTLLVGLWLPDTDVQGTPPYSYAAAAGVLPLGLGPYAYSLGGTLTDGTYSVMGWIDANANGSVDDGEPRSSVKAATIKDLAPVAGLSVTVTDDYDNDGLPEWWKLYWFRLTSNPLEYAPGDDPDKDGLTNLREYTLSVQVPGWLNLNPANWDSDNDGMDDKWEVDHNSLALGFGLDPTTADDQADVDGDGLSNWQEYCGADGTPRMVFDTYENGVVVGKLSPGAADDLNPLDIDSDFDLLLDSFEAAWYDPTNRIDPHAGVSGGFSLDAATVDTSIAREDSDQDGLSNFREQSLLLPFREGGANEGQWLWDDRVPFAYLDYYTDDGVHMRVCTLQPPLNLGLDRAEAVVSTANRARLRAHAWTDPTDGTGYRYTDEDIPPGYDTDNDWLPDGWEVEFNLDPRDDGMTTGWDNGPFGDPDEDGRMNWFEYLGQDGERNTTRPYINGTGDETNPNEYNHRPDSTYQWRWYSDNLPHSTLGDPRTGAGINRGETLGSALPTRSLGTDRGDDSDDDGILDTAEITPAAEGQIPTSPVHSCDPFVPRAVRVMTAAGIAIPDPEPQPATNVIPAGVREDLQRRDWTVECMVNLQGTNLTGNLLDFVTRFGPQSRIVYRLSLSNNIPAIVFQHSDGAIFRLAANPLPTNQWVHLAGVWDHANLNLRLYVQGVLMQGITVAGEGVSAQMLPATNILALAASPNGSFTNRLLLDEVRIWGLARRSAQIAEYATRLLPQGIGDDVWVNKDSLQYYGSNDVVLVNGGSLFEGEPGVVLSNVYANGNNFWIDNGDAQFNQARDTVISRDSRLAEGLPGTPVADVVYNDKDGSGDFTRVALLAYYRFDDGGATIEDFARKAKSGLIGSTREEFAFGDQGYALPTNGLQWVDGAPVLGVDETGADDSDHDGLPDGWELVYRLDPYDDGAGEASAEGLKDGPYGPLGDPDRDGLRNLYEYWAEVNPQAENSDGDEFPDTQEDLDGDGVVNLTEQELGSRPDAIDTDDDGSPDNVEQGNGTSPADPLDPFVSRAVHLDGAAADYLEVPVQLRQALTDWTIEAWVKPDTAAGGAGTVLRRVVQTPAGSSGSALNYLLGVETNGAGLRMVAGYIRTDGTQFLLRGGSLATGVWTHLAAAYNSQTATLALYTNGTTLATTNKFYLAPPLNGKGPQVFVRIGEDFQGSLDEVRLWNRARTLAEIAQNYEQVVSGTDTNGLVHHFRFDDGQATTNEFPWSAFHQPQGLQDFVFQQDWNDQWRHAARIRGSVQITEPGAFVPPPSLRVYLQPDAARVAGAAWSLDGGGWQASGDLLENLDPGPHTLQFKTITGWGEPPGETVTLLDGVVTTLTREYTPGATLTVNLEPAEARAAGARWRVDGGEWMLSGAPVSNLSASTHTVDFLSPAGWLAPPVESVTLLPSESLTLTRTFQPILGGVTVFLLPDQAIADGAQWNVDGGGWQPSGGSVTNLTLTSHTVQFRPLPSWLTPAAQSFSLSNATHVVLTGAYRQVTGVLVDLAPPEAVTNGARWQLNNGPMTNSGVFQEVVAGVHTVRFASVTGWVQPADATVTVVDQLTTRLTGTYYQYEVFGGPGTNVGQFINPRGLALDASRRLYVADSGNHRIQRLDPRTGTWTAFGQFGTGAAGQLRLPHGLDLGSDGLVYVADAGNNRVQRFDPATLAWAVWGGYGTGLGQFNSPLDVAVDSAQNLYVADMMNDRVQRRTPAGVWSVFIASGTGNGLVHDPRGLAFDVAGRLYVADDGTETNGQSRIQTFAADGAYLARIGSRNAAEGGLRRPAGLDFDLATNLYAAEISLGRALVYKPAAATWSALTATNMLGGPEDVAWDPRGKLFVADTDHHRILLVNLTPEAAIITPPSVGVAFAGLPPVVTLSWLGQFGWLYTAQFAPNMAGAWNNLADAVNLLGTNGTMSCQDAGAVSTTSRYYRVLMY